MPYERSKHLNKKKISKTTQNKFIKCARTHGALLKYMIYVKLMKMSVKYFDWIWHWLDDMVVIWRLTACFQNANDLCWWLLDWITCWNCLLLLQHTRYSIDLLINLFKCFYLFIYLFFPNSMFACWKVHCSIYVFELLYWQCIGIKFVIYDLSTPNDCIGYFQDVRHLDIQTIDRAWKLKLIAVWKKNSMSFI